MLATAARRAQDVDEREQALVQIGERVEVAVHALRSLITDLRPAALDLGLRPALEALAERATRTSGLEVELRFDVAADSNSDVGRFAPELEDAVYRIVQEALTNVVKHAGTSSAEVLFVETERTIEVAIRDHGLGFDADDDSAGFGLVGIRERVALYGGGVTLETRPGDGTVLRVSVPTVPREQPEARAQV